MQQEARTIVNNILMGVSVLTFLTLVAAGLILFVNLVRSGQMQWKRSAKFGVLVAILGFLGALNGLPLTYHQLRHLDASDGLEIAVAVGVIVVPIVEGLLAWLLIGSAASLYPDAWKLFSGAARRVWRRDALVALILSLAAGAGLARVDAILTTCSMPMPPLKMTFSPRLSAPGGRRLGFFLSGLTRTLIFAAVVGLATLSCARAGDGARGGYGWGWRWCWFHSDLPTRTLLRPSVSAG